MSKNFELLLQAGAVGHYFHDVDTDAPDNRSSSGHSRYHAPRNEEFAQLVRRIFLNSSRSRVHSLMIAGASCSGKPAEACARIGQSLASLVDDTVCLVDTDIDHPSLHSLFGDNNLVGFADALFHAKSPKALVRPVGRSNLHFLPAGTKVGNSRIMEADFSAPLECLKREFDYLVVAAPSADRGRSLNAIGSACDGALLALDTGGVPLNVMLRIKRQFDASDIPLFGVVLGGANTAGHHTSTISPSS